MAIASGFIHVNVNCAHLEKSIAFYEALGFHIRDNMDTERARKAGGDTTGDGVGIPGEVESRARLMSLGDGAQGIFLDLIEWTSPKTEGRAYEKLNHAGIARIALKCEDVRAAYQELKAKGFTFLSEPREAHYPKWYVVFVTCLDPDGTAVELVQGPVIKQKR
jgi:catechol 2,3-dioxygenase-like lactoylglutathione lyase family enzyme